jgi:hypothetical protein
MNAPETKRTCDDDASRKSWEGNEKLMLDCFALPASLRRGITPWCSVFSENRYVKRSARSLLVRRCGIGFSQSSGFFCQQGLDDADEIDEAEDCYATFQNGSRGRLG